MDDIAKSVFRKIFATNSWGGTESFSGPGSSLAATDRVRPALLSILRELDVKSMLDAPCGDFHWMKTVDLGDAWYVGADIVPEIIEANKRAFATAKRQFLVADIATDPLPAADLVLCRDALVHLPNEKAASALKLFRDAGSKYLLSTSFRTRDTNGQIPVGGWRPINLCVAPFGLGEPLRWIEEGHAAPYQDKCLGLWDLRTMKL